MDESYNSGAALLNLGLAYMRQGDHAKQPNTLRDVMSCFRILNMRKRQKPT